MSAHLRFAHPAGSPSCRSSVRPVGCRTCHGTCRTPAPAPAPPPAPAKQVVHQLRVEGHVDPRVQAGVQSEQPEQPLNVPNCGKRKKEAYFCGKTWHKGLQLKAILVPRGRGLCPIPSRSNQPSFGIFSSHLGSSSKVQTRQTELNCCFQFSLFLRCTKKGKGGRGRRKG